MEPQIVRCERCNKPFDKRKDRPNELVEIPRLTAFTDLVGVWLSQNLRSRGMDTTAGLAKTAQLLRLDLGPAPPV